MTLPYLSKERSDYIYHNGIDFLFNTNEINPDNIIKNINKYVYITPKGNVRVNILTIKSDIIDCIKNNQKPTNELLEHYNKLFQNLLVKEEVLLLFSYNKVYSSVYLKCDIAMNKTKKVNISAYKINPDMDELFKRKIKQQFFNYYL